MGRTFLSDAFDFRVGRTFLSDAFGVRVGRTFVSDAFDFRVGRLGHTKKTVILSSARSSLAKDPAESKARGLAQLCPA